MGSVVAFFTLTKLAVVDAGRSDLLMSNGRGEDEYGLYRIAADRG